MWVKTKLCKFGAKKRIFRKEVDILGITGYQKLSFHKHIKSICQKELPSTKS